MSGRRHHGPTGGFSPRPPRPPSGGTPSRLPDFDLADLHGFEPSALRVDTEVGAFVLALAAVFNDLKGCMYVSRLIANALKPEPPIGHKGQLAGMQGQAVRILAGVLHELMVLIENHEAVVTSASFTGMLAGLPRLHREAWQRVQKVALGRDRVPNAHDADSQILVKLRNNIAFHYGVNTLGQAYEAFFSDRSKPLHERAVISDGTSMEATRFYFADAAMDEALATATRIKREKVLDRLAKVANTVNLAVKHVVMAYVADVASLSPYP